jgi:hypothetical protein
LGHESDGCGDMYFLIHRVVLGLSAGWMCGMQVSVLARTDTYITTTKKENSRVLP